MDVPLPKATEPSKFHKFIQVAFILAIITGIEIVIIWMPLPGPLIFWSLILLSLYKFIAVIAYFMHLKWDQFFLTVLFTIGMVVGTGTVTALMLLFMTDRTESSVTIGDEEARAPAVVEARAA